MSLLVNDNGRAKTYVVVDPSGELVLAGFNYVQEAQRGLVDLQKTASAELAIHNITHPKCPDWLKAYLRSDRDYCQAKASENLAGAATLRKQAAGLVSQAEEAEKRASEWRALAEAAPAPKEPGM